MRADTGNADGLSAAPMLSPQPARAGLPTDWWSIQYLRAIAALMVVVHHCREQFGWVKSAYPSEVGGAGVDVFFIVSGFIMVFITFVKPTTPGDFLIRRIIRIVPIYWFFTLLLTGLVLAAPSLFRSVQFDPAHLLQSLFFIPHYGPDGRLNPMLSLGWTLNYEMLFYLAFAALLPLRRGMRILTIACVFGALVLAGMTWPGQSAIWRFATHSVLLEFVFGMVIADLLVRGLTVPRWAAAGLFLSGLAAFAWIAWFAPEDTPMRAITFGLPAATMAAGLILIERAGGLPHWRPLRLVGDSSYSLYLSHIFTLGALRWIWRALDLPENATLFILAGLVSCTIGGVIAYLIVEKPMLNGLLALLRAQRGALAAGLS